MTREEAIEIIKNYDVFGCGYCHQGGKEIEEAFNMAIESLEQEPKIIPIAEIKCNEERIEELVNELTKNIPTWKLVLIYRWTGFKVWLWTKTHKRVLKNGNND